MFKSTIKMIRINHYLKNIIVFVPLIFSLNFYNPNFCFRTFFAFLSFCMISSVVYIINDIFDINNDKIHPYRYDKPIASGELSIKFAIIISIILFFFSSLIALYLGKTPIIILLLYLILNIFYSYKLKEIILVDALCIAIGFILRVLIGCVSISVMPSSIIILLTFFVSMFFTFSKRKLELKLSNSGLNIKKVLQEVDENLINQLISINAVLSIIFYFIYMYYNTQKNNIYFLCTTTIPFTMIIFRILILTNISKSSNPITFFEKDKILKIFIVVYLILLLIILI